MRPVRLCVLTGSIGALFGLVITFVLPYLIHIS